MTEAGACLGIRSPGRNVFVDFLHGRGWMLSRPVAVSPAGATTTYDCSLSTCWNN